MIKSILAKIDEAMSKERNSKQIFLLIVSVLVISRLLMYLTYIYWSHSIGFRNESIFQALFKWDAGWYQLIIEKGYNIEPRFHEASNAANWAFLPLVPMVMKALLKIIPLSLPAIAAIFNTIIFGGALFVFYKYVALTRKSNKSAILFVALTAFGPYSFYYSTIYTESCFLFFLGMSLYCLKKKKYILMGIFGALLSTTRNIGAFFVFVILVDYIMEIVKTKDYSIKNIFNILHRPKLALGTALCPLGIFVYMAYLGQLMGDPLAFLRIQIAWGVSADGGPFGLLLKAFTDVGSINFYYALWAIWGLIMLYNSIKSKNWNEAILMAIFIFVPLSVRMQSLPRYLVCTGMLTLQFVDCIRDWKKDNKIILFVILLIFENALLLAWFNLEQFVV